MTASSAAYPMRSVWLCLAVIALTLFSEAADALRRPVYGGTLSVSFSEPLTTLDPARAMTFTDWFAVTNLHRSLFRLRADGTPEIDLLAEAPVGESSGQSWLLRLKRNVRFHNGRILRARDVVRSLRRLRGTVHGWVPKRVRLTVVNQWAVRLQFRQPLSSLDLGLLLASPALSIVGDVRGRVGLGPFRLHAGGSSGSGRKEFVFAAQHYRGRPYLDGLNLQVLESTDAVIEAFHYGHTDVVFVESPRYRTPIELPGPRRETVGLLLRESPATADALGRTRVLSHVPRAQIVHQLPGRTWLATSFFPWSGARGWAEDGGTVQNVRWFVAAPNDLESLAQSVAALLGETASPWPVQLLDPERFLHSVARTTDASSRWDALLLSWCHIDPWPTAAQRTLGSLGGDPDGAFSRDRPVWIPLLDRARTAVHTGKTRGLRWSYVGSLSVEGAWQP